MIIIENLYPKENIQYMKKFKSLAPELYGKYVDFSKTVLNEGTLTRKEKEIIAVAVSCVTECPYCIDFHTKKAKDHGATVEELFEAILTAAAIEAEGPYAHRLQMYNASDENPKNMIYDRSDIQKLDSLTDLPAMIHSSAASFFTAATSDGKLSAKMKELIAVSVAHTTECPYAIHKHTKKARNEGCSKQELAEAVMVAALVKSGGVVTHATNMMRAFEE
ncbi:carboxymuconolactone decarboxylase family protein [Metabacillus arenae]|uniref:Carboxymuconolactone decarboxylase family protein n=1 Tax=Metabacillus arenae TaxID=2771434 RepID=A0A926RZN3_9BACI|nr:carboxymuconolactone decarboxylase family protein [Metabacillus arenae]MBD1383311.1 carboxymuconolactone decarboxylase family protein [Metabacillus arenae]